MDSNCKREAQQKRAPVVATFCYVGKSLLRRTQRQHMTKTGAIWDNGVCCSVLSGSFVSESEYSDPLASVWDISGQI